MRPKITWIAVADGNRATVYQNSGPSRGLEIIPGRGGHQDVPPSHEILSDSAGRMGSAGARGGAAMDAGADPHEREEARFAERFAEEINRAALEQQFDRLILAAPPRTLGILRKSLSEKATRRLTAEIDKDLTKTSRDDLAEHLADHLPV
jgi:protein required for attachment to host cells